MQTIFFLYQETCDEGPSFRGFASTLEKAVEMFKQLLEQVPDVYRYKDYWIEEYEVDALPAIERDINQKPIAGVAGAIRCYDPFGNPA